MKKTISILIILIITFVSCLDNNKSSKTVKKTPVNYQVKIDSLLNHYDNNKLFMGSVIIATNRNIVYEKSIGYSDLKKNKKATIDTKYRIGSVTKSFTAALIFKAIEENILDINKTIEHYFPNVKNGNKISIAQLLQHRSGIHSFTKDKWFFDNRTKDISSKEMLNKISKYDSDFVPNTKGEYSNSNYYLLALILEKIYNTSYENLLQDKICKPLNLNNTYSGKEIDVNSNESYSYKYDEKWIKFPETNLSTAKGTGSIVSTVKDLNTFFENLLIGNLLSAESLTLMKKIKDRYGMGLFRYTTNDRQGFGHRGRIDEFRTTSIYFSKDKLSFTLISNGSKLDINEIYSEILKLYLGERPVNISEKELLKFVGSYVSQKDPNDKSVFIQENNTLINFIKNEFKAPLIYKGNNRFVLEQMYAESISFTFSKDGKQVTLEQGGDIGMPRNKEE